MLSKIPWYLILGILLVALGIRVLALLSLSETPYFDRLLIDEHFYHTWASQLAAGTYLPTTTYPSAPLPAYVMAGIYKVLGPSVLYIRLFYILLGSLTCLVIYLIGVEVGNRPLGLMAATIAALYKPFIFYNIVPLKTTLSVFLFSASVYACLAAIRTPSFTRKLLLGIMVGLTITTRENAIVLLPLVFIMVLWSEYTEGASFKQLRTSFAIVLVGVVIVLAPFAIRNYRVSGDVVLTSHQSGITLYLGNNLGNPDPYYRPVPFASPTLFFQETQFRIEASRRVGRKLTPRENSEYWIREVGKVALAHPADFMWKVWQKILVLFNQFDASDHYNIDFMSRFATFFKFPFIDFAVILPLGLAGMAISAKGSRKLLCATAIFWAYASTLVIFFTNGRYRLLLDALLIPFAVIGLRNFLLAVAARKVKTIGIFVTVLIVFSIVEYLPVQGTDDVTAYYNAHGVVLNAKGFEEEAIRFWEISAHMGKPYSAYANHALARKYFERENFGKVLSYLVKIQDDSMAASMKHDLMGDVFLRQQDVTEAIAHYERSLAINSGNRETRAKLVKLLESTDHNRALQEFRVLQYVASFYQGVLAPSK